MSDPSESKVKYYGIPFVLLFGFWLILSPGFSAQTIFLGGVVSLLVVIYSKDLLFHEDEMPLYRLKHFLNMVHFIGILLVEIVKANIDVAKIVLNPALPISPQFIRVPMMLKNDMNKVIFGNSVTLTPGTLTVDIDKDGFIIHALTDEAAEAMKDSFIETWVVRQEENK
ncbi:Na+/H+ antiporter subunit E [Anoxynatronum sibiricum]|uniref:Na+/H+ antiporter subunit E n=1 Tax=Anoxynatronum sibiricum TaxID=210623 RepID=A0ABU9VQ03_9CLOT